MYDKTFAELMKIAEDTFQDIEGCVIKKCSSSETDHHIVIEKNGVQVDCIRRNDGSFINWSAQIL